MKQAGFSLLEAMVALALTALVLVTVRGVVNQVADTRDHALAAADRIDHARAALGQIAADLDATVAPDPTAPPRIEVHAASPRQHVGPTLRIATATADALAETHIVTYAIVTEPTPHLVRRGPFGEITVLDPVRSFRVRALGNTEWADEWLDEQPPRAIEIALDDDLQTIVAIPMGAWR